MLDTIGMTQNVFLPWTLAVIGFSLIAFVYVCRRENDAPSRFLWLILLIAVPILSPLVVFLYYWLLQPACRNRKGKTA